MSEASSAAAAQLVAGSGSDSEAAIGYAILMSDTEAAIAAAASEMATLSQVISGGLAELPKLLSLGARPSPPAVVAEAPPVLHESTQAAPKPQPSLPPAALAMPEKVAQAAAPGWAMASAMAAPAPASPPLAPDRSTPATIERLQSSAPASVPGPLPIVATAPGAASMPPVPRLPEQSFAPGSRGLAAPEAAAANEPSFEWARPAPREISPAGLVVLPKPLDYAAFAPTVAMPPSELAAEQPEGALEFAQHVYPQGTAQRAAASGSTPAPQEMAKAPTAPAAASVDAQPARASRSLVPPATRRESGDAAAAQSGPTQGDVYLDGERVGRWMSDALARAVAGPAGGSTAFDPTMTPAWPGALQGH